MTGDEFQRALLELHLSQRVFASKAGVTSEAVNRWCRGKKPIPAWVDLIVDLLRRVPADDER
jgi:transcriptional regulator with XRE-family HTH domain